MSQREANEVNKAFRAIVIGLSIVVGIIAIIYNPAHLVTAGCMFFAGLDAQIVEADEFDLRS